MITPTRPGVPPILSVGTVSDELGVAARLFLAGESVAQDSVRSMLGPPDLEDWIAAGLLTVANPPFVISPETKYVFRDSPERGDRFCRSIIRSAPEHLEEGGWLQLLVSWPHVTGRDWEDDLREWFDGPPLDAWVLRLESLTPQAYGDEVSDVAGHDQVCGSGDGGGEYVTVLDGVVHLCDQVSLTGTEAAGNARWSAARVSSRSRSHCGYRTLASRTATTAADPNGPRRGSPFRDEMSRPGSEQPSPPVSSRRRYLPSVVREVS